MAWLTLGLLLPAPPGWASRLRSVSWEKLHSLPPGTLLWVDLQGGERQALRLVGAGEQRVSLLDLPGDWPDKGARAACEAVARHPDAGRVEVGKGAERRALEVAPALRRLERGQIVSLTQVERGSGRRGLGWLLGGVVVLTGSLLGLAAAYAD